MQSSRIWVGSIAAISWVAVGLPAIAHNVKASGNVAATFHLEPNHNPKAGEPSQVWFALTQQGGEIIPLEKCDCTLKVYDSQKTVVLQPNLKAIAAEQYQGIPGAEVVFPKSGIYQLEISGTPKSGATFNSFKLAYDVTVQAGQAGNTSNTAQDSIGVQVPEKAAASEIPVLLIVAIVGLISLGVLWFVKRK